MIPVNVKLKVKYGLRKDPSNEQISAWLKEVGRLVTAGEDPEIAGRRAAINHLGDVDACLYASEADNIAALLMALSGKK